MEGLKADEIVVKIEEQQIPFSVFNIFSWWWFWWYKRYQITFQIENRQQHYRIKECKVILQPQKIDSSKQEWWLIPYFETSDHPMRMTITITIPYQRKEISFVTIPNPDSQTISVKTD
jgi:hypothetical protein